MTARLQWRRRYSWTELLPRKEFCMRRFLLLALCCCVFSCDWRLPSWVRSIACDAPPTAPITVDILCDVGGGSSACSEVSLANALLGIAPVLGPGSVVRLYAVSDNVSASGELARFVAGAPVRKTRRELASFAEAQKYTLLDDFQQAAAPLFRPQDRHASPIAEHLVRCVLAGNPSGGVHHVVILTDARQVSGGRRVVSSSDSLQGIDLECGDLLSVDDFTTRLQAALPPDGLRGVVVHFGYVALTPVDHDRCAATVERYAAVRELWVQTLTRLGAQVFWSMDSVNGFSEEHS